MGLVAIPRALRSSLGSEIDGDIEDGLQGSADGLLAGPAGQPLGLVVEHDDLALDVAGDDSVADGPQSNGQAFLFRGYLLLEALALGDIADHGHIKFLLIHFHLAQ